MKPFMRTERSLQSFIMNILITILIFAVGYVVEFILISFFLIYRIFATILIKAQYKNAVMFSSSDTWLVYGKSPDENQLMYSMFCSGSIDMEFFRSRFLERTKHHEKLYSYIEQKYGYFFWLKEDNFNINEHMLYHSDVSISTEDQWKKFQKSLYYDFPISKGFSPWYIHFVPLNPSYKADGKSYFYMVAMFYHCIGDGYAGAYNYIKFMTDYEEPKMMLPATPPLGLIQKISISWQGFLFMPYLLKESLFGESNILLSSLKRERQVYSDIDRIETEAIKTIKNSARVPFFMVILTSMMGALEKYFLKTKQLMPREIIISVPYVMWKPEDEVPLTNNFVLFYLTLPFNGKTAKDRLHEIHKIVRSFRTRVRFTVNYVLMKYLGNFFISPIVRWFLSCEKNSAMLSIAAIEDTPRSVLGQRILLTDQLKQMITIVGNVRIVFQAITLGKQVHLSVHSNSTAVSEQDIEEIIKDFEEEVLTLKKEIL